MITVAEYWYIYHAVKHGVALLDRQALKTDPRLKSIPAGKSYRYGFAYVSSLDLAPRKHGYPFRPAEYYASLTEVHAALTPKKRVAK